MNRRSLIIVLIGMLAGFSGLATVGVLRQNRCKGLGGEWQSAVRACALEDGGTAEISRTSDFLLGALVAIGLGFMLFRMFLYATGRMGRSMQP
jgi:cytochrome c biogenesis protein CcdA